ncbi:unnamed protein product [Allacma fusca]|uniref:Chitin-binding type-2 domain-containing protein n=1 Tax=Allacma fusca TaxID=39272 RepID=A0A8J2K643_9HEXA|nr:unnamed protein product [Allacma fusca]
MEYFKTFLLLILLSQSLRTESRIRRQSDSTLDVVGMAVDNRVKEQQLGTVKTVSKDIVQRTRGKRDLEHVKTRVEQTTRKKRQLQSFLLNAVTNELPTNNVRIPELGKVLNQNTRDQAVGLVSVFLRAPLVLVAAVQRQVYDLINSDFGLATALKNSAEVQNDPILDRMIILNQNGVTCEDVCQNGNAVGAIGICTNQYCTCYFKSEDLRLRFCPTNTIFDPLTSKCAKPEETILCSDDETV